MSLATFKKKSINRSSSAIKHSGKLTNEYWIYQGPYGIKSTNKLHENLPSTIFNASLVGPNGEVGGNFFNASNSGFSINGPHRNKGSVGSGMAFSKTRTPFRGVYPKGWGGTNGRYPDGPNNVMLNINPDTAGPQVQSAIVKPSVLSTKGMLERRFRWIHSGQYPNNWVQPVYTGNQTDTASQGLYIQNKSAANFCHYDVNNPGLYVDYRKTCGSTGCQKTPARGYTMNIQTANAAYTKTLHQPKDASDYTLRVQRRCQDPIGHQKPFPFAVQTGTGVLRGGTSVSHVASSCGTSNIYLTPPEWYTGKEVATRDALLKDQTQFRNIYDTNIQDKVFQQTFLEGTTN